MNKQQLASKIWESANKMRSKIEAHEYKDYILGFIFYKFLSDKEEEYLKNDLKMTDLDIKENLDNETIIEDLRNNLGYYISYKNLYSTWISMKHDFNVENVTDALSAFTREINPSYKKVFYKIFDTLEKGLSKLGESNGARTKAISELLYLIHDIPMNGKEDYDVLGFIYEYLISQFAANAGKKAGEFYTPHEVSVLMSEIIAEHLKDRQEIQIYDPTSGSGSLLINIGQSVAKHIESKNRIKYFAQELKENAFNLTRMNLIMRGIEPSNIEVRNGDTLKEDWPYFDQNDFNTYKPLYVDAVVSNPPYSQAWDSTNKENDARYKNYGLAPNSKADYAFLLHDLYHVKPDGIMAIVLPHGVLFRGGNEEEIRKNLIENNNISAVIGLPSNIFYGTGIPTVILILNQKRKNTDVLIIDASKGFIKQGKNNALRSSDIKRILDAITNRQTINGFSKVVSKQEIRENQYNLNIPRYVDSTQKTQAFDIYATMNGGIPNKEIDLLEKYWNIFPSLRGQLFINLNKNYSKSIDFEHNLEIIENNIDVKNYVQKFKDTFEDFEGYLKELLIANPIETNINKVQVLITKNIFEKLENFSLIDKYVGYQIFANHWSKIADDLETLKNDGIEQLNKVEPNLIIKKKNNKNIEEQDGWIGKILPFQLVESIYFVKEQNQIKNNTNTINENETELNSLLESFTEEYEQYLNEDKNKFDFKEIDKAIKQIDKKANWDEESEEFKLLKVQKLNSDLKALNKENVNLVKELNVLVKEKMESLTLDESLNLLHLKWNKPIISELLNITNNVINDFASQINNLVERYDETLNDIEDEIVKTAIKLDVLLNELTGDEFDMKGISEFKKLLTGE